MQKLKLIPLIITLFILTSCVPQNTELKYRLIIAGIGVDYNNENDFFDVTVQVLDNTTSADEKSPVSNYFSSGKTVAEAITALIENTGKFPLYSQNRIIVLGKSVAGDRIYEVLNFFVREYTSRPDVFVAAASGSAKDILTKKQNNEVSAKTIEAAIETSGKNALSIDTELYNTVNLSLESTSAFTLPLLEITDKRNEKGESVKVTGTWCFKKENPVMLSAEETTAFMLLTNKVKNGTVSINADGAEIALEIIKSKTKTKTKSNKPEIEIEINIKADVVEFADNNFNSFDSSFAKTIEKAAEEYINSITNSLVKRMLKEEKCDIFRFGTRLNQKFGSDYTQDNSNYLENMIVDIKTNVTVNRIGQMNIKQQDRRNSPV